MDIWFGSFYPDFIGVDFRSNISVFVINNRVFFSCVCVCVALFFRLTISFCALKMLLNNLWASLRVCMFARSAGIKVRSDDRATEKETAREEEEKRQGYPQRIHSHSTIALNPLTAKDLAPSDNAFARSLANRWRWRKPNRIATRTHKIVNGSNATQLRNALRMTTHTHIRSR